MSLLDVVGLCVRRGERSILGGVTFSVSAGEFTALMGESGGGKTTLLRAIAGLVPFDAGEVHLDGLRLEPGSLPGGNLARGFRKKIGLVFQAANLFGHLTVRENVALAPIHVLRLPAAEAESRALALLELLGVAHRQSARVSEISGGEAQRVAIARALAMEPSLLLMDEPTAALDPGRRQELGELLRSLHGRGTTLLVVTHDREFARTYAARTLNLSGGRIAAEDAAPG